MMMLDMDSRRKSRLPAAFFSELNPVLGACFAGRTPAPAHAAIPDRRQTLRVRVRVL